MSSIQSNNSRNSSKENVKVGFSSGKRKCSEGNTNDIVSKKLCKDLELSSGLQDESIQDLPDVSYNAYQINRYGNHFPHCLIGLMYQLDVSILCSIRRFIYEDKYPSLSLEFGNSEIDEFNNIVLHYKKKSVHIQVVNTDRYTNNDVNYARLFTKLKRSFSIKYYFNSFVKYVIFKSDNTVNNVKYLVIYTNSCLDLTKEKILKQGLFENFYQFKFDSINVEEHDILKDFLFTKSEFYQFGQEKTTREELLKRLKLSPEAQKVIRERNFPQKFETKLKEEFLDKLVFAVNQPSREELNNIIKNEIDRNSKIHQSYIALQKEILHDLTTPKKNKKLKKLVNYISGIIYEFHLLMFFLHNMFLHEDISSISYERNSYNIHNDITINYKGKNIYLKTHTTDGNIDYCQLFSSKQQNNMLFILKLFTVFVKELKKNIKYFIIYTNVNLGLTHKKTRYKTRHFKDPYPIKFDNIDIQRKKYKILRDCPFISKNVLYQFAHEEGTRGTLLKLLKLPPSLQKEKEEGKLSNENEKEKKEKFLSKLIFAVDPFNKEKLSSIKNKINKSNKVPYNYEELHEIALRWSESHEFVHITKDIMKKIFEDIKNNRFSCKKIQNKNINEEIKFTTSVVGKEGTVAFDQFLNFLIREEKLETLKRNGIKLATVSCMLRGAGTYAPTAFRDLEDLWFDYDGNKTRYLKTLEGKGINLSTMSSMLHKAGVNASATFEGSHDLWFDKKGNKQKYLKTLEKEEVNLATMSSILNGAGVKAAKVFKKLYNLWFDTEGNKKQCLKILEAKGISLANLANILSGAGADAPKSFINLYDSWFNEKGDEKQNLKILEKEGISLVNMSSILRGAGVNSAIAFNDLYDLWFDEEGNKKQYLETLEEKRINLSNISSILRGAGANAARAFKDLYDFWFDEEGNKKQSLETLEGNGIYLTNISSLLYGAGASAPEAFKELYYTFFDEHGNKQQCLKIAEKDGINLTNTSSILSGAGVNAAKAFTDLYNLLFDEEGNKKRYLKILEKEGINLANMSSILSGAGVNATKAFKDLYDLWFDEEGNKKQYLETLEEKQINLSNISSILHGAGANAPKAFKELYDSFFDEFGNIKKHLKHFIMKKDEEKNFTLHNLSDILSGAGANAKDAFVKLHSVCFNDKGKRMELLDDFYKADFEPSNLSSILCGTGVRASSTLKKLHSICFNKAKQDKKLLNDFYDAGFKTCDLCSIFSGAVDSMKMFHKFCFLEETRIYLYHFYDEQEGFTMSNLSDILHGAKANICSAFKDFHDICFDETGNTAQLLNDFYNVGFKASELSNILSMAGNNATSILRNFHKSCFNKENYLNHFLAEEEIFTPKNLSKILDGVGINTCYIFEKLHDICFNDTGNRTKYFNKLIKKNQPDEVFNILYEKVRKTSTFVVND